MSPRRKRTFCVAVCTYIRASGSSPKYYGENELERGSEHHAISRQNIRLFIDLSAFHGFSLAQQKNVGHSPRRGRTSSCSEKILHYYF